ncbi:MAG: septum formation initiator family protein [Candidatus Coprovivens sp.]
MSSNSNVKRSVNNKVSSKSNKKKKDSFSRIVFLISMVVLLIIILISTIFSDLQQIIYNKNQTKLLSEHYAELLEEEASLNSEVTKLQVPDYKARRVREDLMYTKDGEIILKILEKDNKKSDTDNKGD